MGARIEDTYLRIIREQYPELGDGQVQILSGGNDHFVVAVGQETLFRFARSVREEKPAVAKFLEVFSQHSPVRIPKPEMRFDAESGIRYEVGPFIPGVSFDPDIGKGFTHDELMTVARQIGRFLSVLHSFPIEQAREIGVDEMDASLFWEYMQDDAYPEYERVIFPHITPKAREWIERLFADYIATIRATPFPTRVTHADMWTFHMIVDLQKHTLSGVIDFAPRIADPANDFKAFEHYGEAFVAEVYANYDAPLDDSFEKRRLYYAGHDEVFLLSQAIETRDPKQIGQARNALIGYIEAHPHI